LLQDIKTTSAFVSSMSRSSYPLLSKDLDIITNRSNELRRTTQWHHAQLYLTIPLIVYMVLWIVFAIRAYRSSRSSNGAGASTPPGALTVSGESRHSDSPLNNSN